MRLAKSFSVFGVLVLVGIAAYLTRDSWSKPQKLKNVTQAQKEQAVPPIQEAKTLKMSEQARKNLGLVSRPTKPQAYWRTI